MSDLIIVQAFDYHTQKLVNVFRCQHCDHWFFRVNRLTKHIKRVHPELVARY